MEADGTDALPPGGGGHPQSPGDEAMTGAGTTGATTGNALSTAAQQAKVRKRTKTGCLTCRKRRIKCGEERPTCSNCLKSKRQCEGYNQRVVWKQPLGDWPGQAGTIALTHHTSMLPGARGSVLDQHMNASDQFAHQQHQFLQQQQQHQLQQQPYLTPIQIPNNGLPQGGPPTSTFTFSPESAGYQTGPAAPWSAHPAVTTAGTSDGQGNSFGLSVSIPQGNGQAPIQAAMSAPPLGAGAVYPPVEGQGISIPMPWNVQQSAQYFDPRFGGLPPQQPLVQQQALDLGPQQVLFAGAPSYTPQQQQQQQPPVQTPQEPLLSPSTLPPGAGYAALNNGFAVQQEIDQKVDPTAATAASTGAGITWTGTAEENKVRQDSGSDTFHVQPKIEEQPVTGRCSLLANPCRTLVSVETSYTGGLRESFLMVLMKVNMMLIFIA